MNYAAFFEKFISNDKIEKTGSKFGRGAYGEVVGVKIKNDSSDEIYNNKEYAMKLLEKSDIRFIIREGCLLNSLNHPFIINLAALSFFKGNVFEPALITPVAKYGSLSNLIYKSNFDEWTPLECNKIIYGVCRAIWFLHRLNIWHRDIKTDNILIMDDKTPRISDLGMAKCKSNELGNSCIGCTYQYAAPEITKPQASFPCDVFALGLTLWEIFEHRQILNFYTRIKKKQNIKNYYTVYSNEDNRPQFNKTPQIWQDLISSMWKSNPLERPEMNKVIEKIGKPEYFLPGVDENEMISFIKEIKDKENDAYFGKSNSTIEYIKDINSILLNDEDKSSKDGNCNNHTINSTENYFAPLFLKSPINFLIDFFLDMISIEKTNDTNNHTNDDIDYDDNDDNDQEKEPNVDNNKDQESYDFFYQNYISLICSIFGLSEYNDEESMLSIALFCTENLCDYVAAYKILKKLEITNEKKAKSLLFLIEKESENSLFVKAMLLEAQEKYQEAVDAYYNYIDNEKIDSRVLGHLGRILAVLGDTKELRDEGIRLMQNAASLNDQFAAYSLGVIYKEKANNDESNKEKYSNMAIEYFKLADRFLDSYIQLYNYYHEESLKSNKFTNEEIKYESYVVMSYDL